MPTEQCFFPEKQLLKERFYIIVIVGEELNLCP